MRLGTSALSHAFLQPAQPGGEVGVGEKGEQFEQAALLRRTALLEGKTPRLPPLPLQNLQRDKQKLPVLVLWLDAGQRTLQFAPQVRMDQAGFDHPQRSQVATPLDEKALQPVGSSRFAPVVSSVVALGDLGPHCRIGFGQQFERQSVGARANVLSRQAQHVASTQQSFAEIEPASVCQHLQALEKAGQIEQAWSGRRGAPKAAKHGLQDEGRRGKLASRHGGSVASAEPTAKRRPPQERTPVGSEGTFRMTLTQDLQAALQRRATQAADWELEGTDSYRLFHGSAEGRPGLSVDRYGSLKLAQVSSSSPLTGGEEAALAAFLDEAGGPWAIAHREGPRLVPRAESFPGVWSSTFWARELGLEFAVHLERAHRDPQLFLDFRAAKRALKAALPTLGETASVLNLFAYTCSVSCHAASAGAKEVWSSDFSGGNLAWGAKNFRRNRLDGARTEFLEEDCIGLLWALTDQRKALSARKKLRLKISPRQFTVVVADPPAFSKGKFASVDLVRDPETVFGPAWEAVAPGGLLVAANNSSKVTKAEFEERLVKLFARRSEGGACRSLQWVSPESDFPSFDGEPPLKVAFCWKT